MQGIISNSSQLQRSASSRKGRRIRRRQNRLRRNADLIHIASVDSACNLVDVAYEIVARIALPGIDVNGSAYNEERGMSSLEKVAARGTNFGSWPSKIFMPADVQVMLETEKRYAPKKVEIYGNGRK